MKKVYIICLIFVSAVIVFVLSYNYSKNNMGIREIPEQINRSELPTENSIAHTGFKEIKITNITRMYLQNYDMNNRTFSEEKINTPVEMLEMTREDLIEYMESYLKNPDEDDVKRGLVAYELVQFSANEVVIRKTYNKTQQKSVGYYGVIENGYVTIYESDLNTIYDYTDISVNILPEDVKEELINRLDFGDIGELYEFLETYSS